MSDADAAEAAQTAIDIGYRHIDTAAVYQNERSVGEGLRAGIVASGLDRADIFVTTKLWPGFPGSVDQPTTPEEAVAACTASLDRLGLDYVDLLLIHSPHGGPARIAQWQGLLAFKQSGRARNIGVSNFNRNHLEAIEAAGLERPDANQIELHPWSQKPDLVSYMRDKDITPIAYSSLAPLATWRTAPGEDSAKTEQMRGDAGVFEMMAERYGVSAAQLLLRWGIQKGYAVLPKSLNPARMKENLSLDGFAITAADMDILAGLDRGDGIAWSIGDPSRVD